MAGNLYDCLSFLYIIPNFKYYYNICCQAKLKKVFVKLKNALGKQGEFLEGY